MMKSEFLLDPNIIFLNHGSFGACPRPVFEVYQGWQRELERQPVEFLGRRVEGLLEHARQWLASYLGVQPDEIVYFTNPTHALNMVAASLSRQVGKTNGSLHLQPGDEILSTDHEYGAVDRIWRYHCHDSGLRYVSQPIPLPLESPAQFVERFWAGVTPRTRLIFLSHISSPTALVFPVAEICLRARRANILTVVDGAHAPGQLPLDLSALGADIYAAACHKWLCAPKGSAFLYARHEVQPLLDPLVVSWGYQSDRPSPSQFVDYHEWQGTRDFAAFLSVPAAIDFQAHHQWYRARQACHLLACQTRQRLVDLTSLPGLCPEDGFRQMFAARLPERVDLDKLKRRLLDEYRIEVPTGLWNGQKLLRVSFQGYNTQGDADALLEALQRLLP